MEDNKHLGSSLEEALIEENLHICKRCKKLKKRISDGKFNDRDKRWKDDEGLLWSGKVCGSCNRDRARETMQKARAKKETKKDII